MYCNFKYNVVYIHIIFLTYLSYHFIIPTEIKQNYGFVMLVDDFSFIAIVLLVKQVIHVMLIWEKYILLNWFFDVLYK